MTEDEMVGWHHRLNGHESPSRKLVLDREAWRCCNSWALKELDTTE